MGVGGWDGQAFIQLHLADCILKRNLASGYLVSLAPRPLPIFSERGLDMILDTLLGFRMQGKTRIMKMLSGGWGPNIVGPHLTSSSEKGSTWSFVVVWSQTPAFLVRVWLRETRSLWVFSRRRVACH